MVSPPFDTERFARALVHGHGAFPGFTLGSTILCFERLGSTQEAAHALAGRGASHGTIVLAEEQTAGRGRRGRKWRSPRGGGIWATVILRRPVRPGNPQWLTLAGALAICEAVRTLGVKVAEIKWPNDLIAGGAKIAGVLGELIGERSGAVALLGLGVNVDLDLDGAGTRATRGSTGNGMTATSLRAEGLRAGTDREEVLAEIMVRLEEAIEDVGRGRTAALVERWRIMSPSSAGRRVIVEPAGEGAVVRGVTRGISADGSLAVEEDGGSVRIVRFGGTLRFDTTARRSADASGH